MSGKQIWCAWVAGCVIVLVFSSFSVLPTYGRQPAAAAVRLEQAGYVIPSRLVSVSSQVGGQVVELKIVEGQSVKKGDVLARIDSALYKAKVEYAKASVAIATAEEAKLLKHAKYEQDLFIAREKVRQAKAKLEIAQWRLDATVIRSPLAGTILAKKTEEGNIVAPPASGSALAAGICEIADLRELEVELSVQERDIHRVAKGQACHIQLDAFPKTSYKGRVTRLMPVADRAKGAISVRVKIDVPDKDTQLRPELRALVKFLSPVQ
jgi:HlyD family secretion protein